jgi:hypothetical protein
MPAMVHHSAHKDILLLVFFTRCSYCSATALEGNFHRVAPEFWPISGLYKI